MVPVDPLTDHADAAGALPAYYRWSSFKLKNVSVEY